MNVKRNFAVKFLFLITAVAMSSRRFQHNQFIGVNRIGPLQDLYERCKEAIYQAQAEKRISNAPYAAE